MSNYSISVNYGFFMDNDDRFRLIKECGFSGVGLWWGKKCEGFDISCEEQFVLAKKYDLKIDYIHAPFSFHNMLRADDIATQKEGIAIHERWIDTAFENNVRILVLHLNRLTDEEYITPNLIKCLTEINEYAKSKQVMLALENIGRPHDLSEAFDQIEDIYFCFDSSHASLEGDTDGKLLEKYIDRLVCTHFSDNDGAEDRHWSLGKGIIDFANMAEILKKHNYKGMINCEVFEDGYSSPKEFLTDLYMRTDSYFGELNVSK